MSMQQEERRSSSSNSAASIATQAVSAPSSVLLESDPPVRVATLPLSISTAFPPRTPSPFSWFALPEQQQRAASPFPDVPYPGPPNTVMSMTKALTSSVIDGLPEYQLKRELNNGYFGRVYEALHRPTNMYYAVKVVERAPLTERQARNVVTEATIMQRVRHRNVIALKSFVETPKYYILVMEIMRGGDLFDRISEKVRLF